MQGPVPEGPDVILTGEYTPFNLLHQGSGLSAMFDFGDGLVGPREYDWLGPLCFLAAGDAARIDALFDGYHGRPFDRGRREALLRLVLLHRYSNLKAQISHARLADRARLRRAGCPDLALTRSCCSLARGAGVVATS